MATPVASSTVDAPGRKVGRLGVIVMLALVAAALASGCAGTASLLRPDGAILDARPDRSSGAEPSIPGLPPRTKSAVVVRAQSAGSADPAQSPSGPPATAPAPGPPDPADPAPPAPSDPVDDADLADDQPVRPVDGTTLYRYDPMRGAALSPEPPLNRNITLRELLGLGRSDIAEDADERPTFPRLHDDPLARSPVSPEKRDRLLLPWLSNLAFEHNWELKEDADDARGDVLTRRSNYDVTLPGPDTANFPNSAFTLPKGRVYIESSPVSFFGKSKSFPAQYNWEFLIRYGLTDDLEFRLYSPGYSATLSSPRTTGFSPLTFDFKYHLWDENLARHIPAAGVEIYIQTPFGSDFFNGGTQPSLALLLDHTLPFDVLLEHNFGLTGVQSTFGEAIYEFSYQWALQRQVFRDFAVFTHGFLNSASLPRLPIIQRHISHQTAPMAVVVGGGFLWNLSRRLAVFGSYNAGLAADSPKIIGLLGFAIAL